MGVFAYFQVIKYKLCRCVKKKHKGRNNNDRGAVLSLDDVKRHVSMLLLSTFTMSDCTALSSLVSTAAGMKRDETLVVGGTERDEGSKGEKVLRDMKGAKKTCVHHQHILATCYLITRARETLKTSLAEQTRVKHQIPQTHRWGRCGTVNTTQIAVLALAVVPCIHRPAATFREEMAARGGFQSAPTGGGGGAMGPGPPVPGAGPGMGPGTPSGRMVPSSAAQNHMYRSPMPGPGYPRPGMPPSSRMTPQGPAMGPPGYGNSPVSRPGMPGVMDPSRKRPAPQQIQQVQQQNRNQHTKKKKMADKILPQRIRELVPESQAYMDLLAFERKLDQTIMRKRLDIQEALKRPIKQKRKLRIFISNTFNPAKPDAEDGEGTVASWELRVEGRLLEDTAVSKYEATKQKRKFSSFFKSLVIELDKDLYGPDNHLVEWHRTATTQETDGFQVKRPGDVGVRCTVLLMLDYQPPQFKLDPRLARMLGIHTQTRPVIIQALWQYVKTHKLQDPHEREFINCDKYLQQIHETIETINQLKTQREFMLSFARDPQGFINDWLQSQCRDLKTMTDVVANPEEERRAEFYYQPWAQEAVCRYFYSKVQQRRQELEQALGIRNT
eukprot:superscaffoldBa00004090_g18250